MQRRIPEASSLAERVSAALGESIPLGRVERRALLGFVLAAIAVGVVIAAIDGFARPEPLVLDILLSLAFVAALWSVPAVPAILLVLVAASSIVDGQQQSLLALAISGGLIVRVSSLTVQALFTLAFVTSAAVVYSVSDAARSTSGLIVLLLVAAGAAMVGLMLRLQVSRGARARAALSEEQQRSARIAQEERQRIADDLHDVVAHDLTGIAMHAQLLARTTDDGERTRSQDAILASSRQALTDLRRVVGSAAEARPGAAGALPGVGVSDAVGATRDELLTAGYDVRVTTAGEIDHGVSRLTVSAVERILREAGTNVVKHAAPPQRVDIEVRRVDGSLRLRIRNSLNARTAAALPSGGYGTVRMQERALLLGGEFRAGPRDGGWLLEVSLPTT